MSRINSGPSTSKNIPDEIRIMAFRQKAIIICILIQLLALVSLFVLPLELRPAVGILVFFTNIISAVFLILLAVRIYGTVMGFLLGILTLVPLIGLFVLLAVNGRATHRLRANDIEVGLFGAKGPLT